MPASFASLRQTDFARLDAASHTYLDYLGAALYPSSILDLHFTHLKTALLGNPHSSNPAATNSSVLLETTRREVLSFFNADPRQYSVIFAANATAAVKLVAESFPFRKPSSLLLSADNHKSITTLRDYADRVAASVHLLPLTSDLRLETVTVNRALHALRTSRHRPNSSPSLFAYPAQSNFSGVRHDLSYVAAARCSGWYTLLDASAFVSTAPLDLSVVAPDFIPISFYKMFGFPTGVGALIARNDALRLLCQGCPGYGGKLPTKIRLQRPNDNASAFEDGTPDYTAIAAVPYGLRYLKEVGMCRLNDHVATLMGQILTGLDDVRWRGGRKAARVYGPQEAWGERGNCVAFDIVRADGSRVDARLIARAAGARMISVGVGCFGNAGTAEYAFKGESGIEVRCKARIGGNFLAEGVTECVGEYWGCIRVSVGMANTNKDVETLLTFLKEFCERAEMFEEVAQVSQDERDDKAASFGNGGEMVQGRRRRRYNSRLGFSTGMLILRRKGGINAEELD